MKLVRPLTITDSNVTSNVTEAEAVWDAGHTYAISDVAYEVVDNVHQKFTSKQNGNINHRPSLDATATYWTANGPTNRWKMFDGAVQSQTVRANSIVVEIDIPTSGRIDTLALLNISGTALQVVVTDPVDGVIYDQTFSLTSYSGINNWWSYYFEPIARLGDKVITGIPGRPGATLTVSVTESGADVAIGALVVGYAKRLGGTRWGAQLGIRDFSVKSENAFGDLVVVKRAYRKRADFSVIVDNAGVDELITLLASYRATPALWVGSDDYASMAIWGYAKDFNVEVPGPKRSFCSLQLESLT